MGEFVLPALGYLAVVSTIYFGITYIEKLLSKKEAATLEDNLKLLWVDIRHKFDSGIYETDEASPVYSIILSDKSVNIFDGPSKEDLRLKLRCEFNNDEWRILITSNQVLLFACPGTDFLSFLKSANFAVDYLYGKQKKGLCDIRLHFAPFANKHLVGNT